MSKKNKNEEVANNIATYINETLKKNFIKNLIQGSNIAYELILEKINKGCTIEELKEFLEKIIKHNEKEVK